MMDELSVMHNLDWITKEITQFGLFMLRGREKSWSNFYV